jgi:hypothetical protein
MPTLYRDTGYSLTHLIEDIRHGNIALPDIQRQFVWSSSKVRALFDSMYRGFPVGTLMFWETGAEVGNQAVFAFRRYEDASLSYTGIESHEGLRHYGLYDTVVAVEEVR